MKNEIGFDISLGRKVAITKKLKPTTNEKIQLRPYQQRVVSELSGKGNWILKSPTGSGKSRMIAALNDIELRDFPNRKIIVSVPQTIIGKGFSEYNHGMPCKVEDLINFISDPVSKVLSGRVILCTHSALTMAWFRLSDKTLLANTSIVLDEFHHNKFGEIELQNEADVYDSNKLGSIAQYAIDNKILKLHIKGVTATFFRGDSNSIIPKKLEENFTKSFVPYDEYLSKLQHLDQIQYKVILYSGSYIDAIKKIKSKFGKHILAYIPRTNSPHIIDDKYSDAQSIISTVGGGNWVDAVNDSSDRKEIKDKLKDENLNARGVVFMAMGKEGFDWPRADTAIVVGPRNSLNEIVQIFGRLFRDYPKKKKVVLYHFVPYSLDDLDEEKSKKNVNNYLKPIYASMAIEDIFQPVKIKVPKAKGSKKSADEDNEETFNEFTKAIPDPNDRAEFNEDVWESLIVACGDIKDSKLVRTKFEEIVSEMLVDNGINCNHKAVADQIWVKLCRKFLLSIKGIDLSNIDIDLIDSVENPMEYFLQFISGVGVDTLKKLRDIIKGNRLTIEDAHRIAAERGGKCLGPA